MKYEVAWSAYGVVTVEADDAMAAHEKASEALADVSLTSSQDVDGWNFKVVGE